MATDRLTPRAVGQIGERLGRYVYVLVDPRDSRPFYVGKGRGARMLAHGIEAESEHGEGRKLDRIRAIRDAGHEPEVWIARYGLTEAEYTAVEAALIDVLSSFPVVSAPSGRPHRPLDRRGELTNGRREDAKDKGLVLLDRLVDELAAPVLTTAEPLLLITLQPWRDQNEAVAGGRWRPGAGFKREWVDPAIRDADAATLELAVSAWWRIDGRRVERLGIQHVVPLFRGVTRGLFRIDHASWEKNDEGRQAFVAHPVPRGDLWEHVVGPHGHRVSGRERGSQNPVLYWPR